MSAARPLVAAMLGLAAYVLWIQQGSAPAAPQDLAADTVDTISETITSYLGIPMTSTRYAAALENPANAGIVGILRAAEQRNGIPDGLLVRQAWQESRFNVQAVNASSGAQGMMQFMPATAAEWGVNVFDAQSSAEGAARYMAWLYQKTGTWPLALAAYNWGVGNIMRRGMAAAPTETQNYVAQIGADVWTA